MAALSSSDHSITPPRITIPREYNAAHDLIERNLSAGRAQKLAYIDDHGSCTYGELAAQVNRFSNALGKLGVRQEQRIVLCLVDSIDFAVAFLGAIKAGVIPVAINTLLATQDFEHVLNDSRAVALFISAELRGKYAAALQRPRFLQDVLECGKTVDGATTLRALLEASPAEFAPAPTTCDDHCFWLYSSGSTGLPKGTVHVHGSLIQTAELYARPIAGFCEDDVVFSVSKLPFAYGLGNSLTFPLAVGATAVLMAERPTPAAIIKRLREHQPTVLCTIPTAYAALLASTELPRAEDLRLRCCTSAGEALPEEVGRRWRQRMGVDILDGIGSTEMLHIFLSNRPGAVRYGTLGKPVPGYEVRIVDEHGQLVALGESGELEIKGPTSALHYWNDRARSTRTFQGEWVRSGDKFRQTPDGVFVYEGRADDMLKVSGLYVSPLEVESVLIEHDAVLEVAVVGKQDADKLVKPCAFVVLRDGCAITAEALRQHVKQRVAPYKYPRWIQFVSDLPRTATGKVQRFKLREWATRF